MPNKPKLDKTEITKDLYIDLTPDEVNQRAKECARQIDELTRLEIDAKTVRATLTANVKKVKAFINDLSHAAILGKEWREVNCIQWFDLKNKETWYTYDDKEYDRRSLSQFEIDKLKQGSLFDDGANLPVDNQVGVLGAVQ